VHPAGFLELIERRRLGSQVALVAHPLRALMDLVTLRKVDWQGLAWITAGLRIEESSLREINPAQVRTLCGVYKQKRPLNFLLALARELHLD
jgi:hypothetical protein